MSKGFYKSIREVTCPLTKVAAKYRLKGHQLAQYMIQELHMRRVYGKELMNLIQEEEEKQIKVDPYRSSRSNRAMSRA